MSLLSSPAAQLPIGDRSVPPLSSPYQSSPETGSDVSGALLLRGAMFGAPVSLSLWWLVYRLLQGLMS
jgi:hypothetical protein